MKKTTFFSLMFFALLCSNMLQAQVNIGGNPMSYNYEKTGILEPITFDQMPPLDMVAIEAEDAQWEAERADGMIKIGRRFGIEFEVDYDLHNSGTWTVLPDGGKLWRLGIECPNAFSINLIFDQYRLPKGAALYIYDENKRDRIGGFTDYNNQADNFFATDIVLSEKIIIEYYQPDNADFDGELRLATVVHGYRGPGAYPRGFGQSGACQRNAICPEGEGWEDQVRSVFSFLSGNMELCSGAMLNNTANDNKPYALTANHCWEYYQNPGIWVFRFHWESPTCTPTINSAYKTMSGAVLRMRKVSPTDACLIELNQPIPEDYGAYFSGWSRSTVPSTSGMCIHHPSADIKKISQTKPLYAVSQLGVSGWRADWLTNACAENGSSGSPLFDCNRRIVGQLRGGVSACGAPPSEMFDVFGRFDLSWEGSDASSRLKDWLDPLNLNPETLDGRYTKMIDAELVDILVPVEFYNSAATIEPKVTIKNNGEEPITSATVSYIIDENKPVAKEWSETLNVGATVDISFDAINLTYGTHVFKATVTVDGDVNLNNNSKIKNYEVIIEDGAYVAYDDYDVVNEEKLTYFSTNSEIAVTLKNVGVEPTSDPLTVTIICDDPQLTIDNGTAHYENIIQPNGTIMLNFNVTVAHNIPDNKIFPVNIMVSDGNQTPWVSIMFLKAYAPKFLIEKVFVNNLEEETLEQGAIASITVVLANKGGADAYEVNGNIESNDASILLTCSEPDYTIQDLPVGEIINLNYVILAAPSIPAGHETNLNFLGSALYDISFSAPIMLAAHDYCVPGLVITDATCELKLVQLSKTSDQSVLINKGASWEMTGYHNYTDINPTLDPGEQYTIKIKAGKNTHIRGWFDLNGNASFDANEHLINFACNVNNQELSQTFTIPHNAVPGTHRFRLRLQYGSEPEACSSHIYGIKGQTHDYSFTIPEIYSRVSNVVAELNGANISVSWNAPGTETPIGYNIYRNDKCLNTKPLTNLTFTEENVSEGIYIYEVTAVYSDNFESSAVASNFICYGYMPPQLCVKPRNPVGISKENTAVIAWSKPKNMDGTLLGYNVYRDGIKIAETERSFVEYRDENLADGTYMYQVSAVYEHCEESELTEGISVTILTDAINDVQTSSFNIYPNPANGNVTIEGAGLNCIEIYDVYGRKTSSHHLITSSSHHLINISYLQSGIYFVKIYSETNQVVVKRLVVIR